MNNQNGGAKMQLLYGILIGMVIWQIVAIILFTINEDKILFKNILGGIPLLALYILFYPIRKYHLLSYFRYHRCHRIVNGKVEDKEKYYCTEHDRKHNKMLNGDDWYISNINYIKKKVIKQDGLIYWKEIKQNEA
uniref:hypothetical protein n=1 Tax=Enterocloster aldenensis TaxID=358742 RepID=UPI0011C34702